MNTDEYIYSEPSYVTYSVDLTKDVYIVLLSSFILITLAFIIALDYPNDKSYCVLMSLVISIIILFIYIRLICNAH